MSRKIKQLLACSLVFIAALNRVSAQDSLNQSPIFAEASLFYDFPQSYGILGGISYPFQTITQSRILKNGYRRQKERFLSLEGGFYRYPFNYSGLLFMPGYGTRHYRSQTFFYQTEVNIGLLRTFYDGTVYEVDASGNIKEKKLFGRFYATAHLSAAADFKISRKSWFELKPSVWFQFPFDSFIKPHLSLQAGFKYDIGRK